jgi:hypothetical protein
VPDATEDDHRAVLGVGREASADEIRTAYRRLSRTAHPDAGGSGEQFRRIRRAYDALAGTADAEADDDDDHAGHAAPPGPPPVARTTGHAAAAAPATPTASIPSRSTGSGCMVVAVLATAALVGLAVLVAVLAATSSPDSSSGTRRAPSPTSPGTGLDAFEGWRSEHQALVAAVVANGQDLGAALSSASGVSLGPLQELCARRVRLLDELAAASPTPREDVTRAIDGFVPSERRAMAACLTSPPSFEDLATWGARGQPDLQIIVRATQPA